MAVTFACSECDTKLSVAEAHVGRKVKCPKCATPNVVPNAAATKAPKPVSVTEDDEDEAEVPTKSSKKRQDPEGERLSATKKPSREPAEEEDEDKEDEQPIRAKKSVRPRADEEEDERPKKKAKARYRDEEEDEDERPSRKSKANRRDVEDEDEDEEDYDDARPRNKKSSTKKIGHSAMVLGCVGLAFGLFGLAFSWLPCVGFLSLPFSVLGAILSLIGVILGFTQQQGKIMPFSALGVSCLAIAMPFLANYLFISAAVANSPLGKLQEADKLYAAGKKAEAVALYKVHKNFGLPNQKKEATRRIIEFEVANGNSKEAERFMDELITWDEKVSFDDPKATELFEKRWKQKNEDALKTPAERALQQIKKKAETAVKVNIEDLLKEYKENEIAANQKYRGKWLQVNNAKVDAVVAGTPPFEGGKVVLKSSVATETQRVECKFHRELNESLSKLKAGEAKVVLGKCDGRVGQNVTLSEAGILD